MSLAAMIVFFVSLVLIVLLFLLKQLEMNRPQRFANGLRTRADAGALRVKYWLEKCEWYLGELPFFVGALMRYAVHIGALGFARLARKSAESAHGLADLVSHKRGFQRRETKSQYLREVSEVKNGNGNDDRGVATM